MMKTIMRVLNGCLGSALIAMLLVNPVLSAPPYRDGRPQGQGESRGRPQGPNGYAPPNAGDQRRMERGERRDGALTNEERQALHRDLDKANRELYRRR